MYFERMLKKWTRISRRNNFILFYFFLIFTIFKFFSVFYFSIFRKENIPPRIIFVFLPKLGNMKKKCESLFSR